MADAADDTGVSRPEWFAAFLADRGTRKPSAHTMKAYRQDFDAIATLILGADSTGMSDTPALSAPRMSVDHVKVVAVGLHGVR